MKCLLKKIKSIFFKIEHRVPYIPNFGDVWTVLKVLLVSYTICIAYSFSELNKISDFYVVFWENLKTFTPYIIVQLILLISNAKLIKKFHPFNSILYMIFLNFVCVYFVYSVMTKSYTELFIDWDTAIAKLSLSLCILFFFLIYFDWREKNIHPAELQAQLSFLQSKMHPHFLFNTINSIVSLIKKEPDTAKKMLLNLSEVLRASLKDEHTFMHSIEKEINLCQKYLDIEKMRLGERLQVVWEIQENIDIKKILIPKLSLQPLLENAILHGIQNLEEGGTVSVSINKDKFSIIDIQIKNNKSSQVLTVKDNKRHNNISMSNLKERLKICFDGDTSLNVKEESEFFIVFLKFPTLYSSD